MKTTYFKRFTRLFVVMLLAMLPAMSWAETYISDVAVSCRPSYAAAYADLEADGYTKIEFEWNHKVDPCSLHGVIMGYKTTTDPTQAITNLIVMEGEQYKCDGTNKQMIIDGKVYRPIKAFGNANTNGDFNSGCASTASKLYVWYTKDVTGDPQVLSSFHGVTSETALSLSTYAKLYSNGIVTANANLNKGAGGNYQYINMTKTKPANAIFKRNFTTWTNTNNTGKAYLRFYDIAKYFDVDVPDGEENVNYIFISDITIDGKSISYQRTFQDDKSIWAGNDVTVTTLGNNVKGGTKKTGFPIDSSHKYRFEINYPHQNVKDIKISGNIEIQVDKREKKICNWEFVLHKELDMYFTYPYHTANGQLYLRYSDIFRFLGYDVSEGALNSFRPLVAQVDGVACAAVSQQEISGLGNSKGVRVGTYSDAGVTIRTVNTSYLRGLIADDVPSGQEDRYGVTITYPRNQSKKFALQMYVAYTYTTNSTYANNEEEDYKMFYVVLSPDPDRVNQLRFCNSNTNNTAATAPLTGKIGEPINLFTYSPNSITRTYSITSSNASNATLSRNSVNGAGYGAFTFTATTPGTYTVATSQVGGDGYFPSTATRSIEISAPTLAPVKAVKPNVELDLKSFFKYYPSGMNATFTCSDANATINGTTFSSAVEGEYIVNVSVVPTSTCGISINEQVKVIVSRHNYPYYEFKAHLDYPDVDNGVSITFMHMRPTLYLPAWDFEAPVCGKNVRFCINDDDETVTLVSGAPIQKTCFTLGSLNPEDRDEEHIDYPWAESREDGTHGDYLMPWSFFSTKNSTLDFQHAVEPLYFDVNYASAYCIDAAELIIPEKVTYGGKEYTVTKIGDGAFGFDETDNTKYHHYLTETYFVCRGTESITLPSSIKEIGHQAFRYTTASSVNFEDLVNLETIGSNTFYHSNLEQVDLRNCQKLESIGMPKGFTFEYCRNLKTVNMSGLQNLSQFGYRDIFTDCNSLQSLDLSNCPKLKEIPIFFCLRCTSLRLPNMYNTPIETFSTCCFEDCNFDGQTFDTRILGSSEIFMESAFENTGLKNLILISSGQCFPFFTVKGDKPMIENIFVLQDTKMTLIDGENFNHSDGTVNTGLRIFMRYNGLTSPYWMRDDVENFGDEHGHRVFPMLSSNTSGVRTMSYFRPLDYKNIKVFDNSHLYGANKPGGGDYELEDFFRTPENIAKNNIEMLTPYIATDYNVENKEVTMTALSETTPGIQTKGGIYYKGTGTSTDGAGNEILYILTEPNYSLVGENKSYTNMYSGVNYLKGGGKESVVLDKAPHMTETSTQFISKGGTFYYSTPGTLAPYKAYLDLPEFIKTAADTDYSSSAKVTSLSFVWEDEPMQESETITSVNAISENRNGDIYNLQGMKVKIPQRSGLYISNGRKVLVK